MSHRLHLRWLHLVHRWFRNFGMQAWVKGLLLVSAPCSQSIRHIAMQVNCFVLTLSTLLINRCAAVGLHMKTQRSIAKQRRGEHEGLKLPWRRMPLPRAAGIVRYSYSLYHHARRENVFDIFRGMCSHRCADWHDVICRPGSPDAASTQIIEQGLAAEHALDMRKAIVCFEVFISGSPRRYT